MRLHAALFLFIVSGPAAAEDNSLEWESESISSQYGKFRAVSIRPCPADKTLLAANCEYEESWTGIMRVFKQAGDRVEWAARFPEEYERERGHYMVSFKWTSLPMLESPVLELIESTHMGNGSLWLLELKGRELRVLLHTRVRGRYWSDEPTPEIPQDGEARFEGSHLEVEYLPTDTGVMAVHLSGRLLITDVLGEARPTRSFLQVCEWDGDKRVFEAGRPKLSKEEGQSGGGEKTRGS